MSIDFTANGSLYGSLSDKWPQSADGTPEAPVFLCHCRENDMEPDVIINLLDAFSIPCIRHYPGDGGFGKVILGMSGPGVDLFVPQSLYEDANNILNGEIEGDTDND